MGRIKEVDYNIERQIIDNYQNKQMSLTKAGKPFGLSQYMVEKTLKKYGIKKRTYTEAKQLGRKYPCDDNFFKNQNENMAYILGFLAADGNVSKKENLIAIQLLASDKELLEQFRQITKNTRPLEYYTRKETSHEIVSFRVWSKAWKDDLNHYGITPQKTFNLIPPTFLNSDYYIDYIRGFFDGDGSIYAVKNEIIVRVQFMCMCKNFIEWLRSILVNQYHILCNNLTTSYTQNNKIYYKFIIGDKKELQKLYHLFYDNKTLYLPRKKEKFELLLNIPRDSNSSSKE